MATSKATKQVTVTINPPKVERITLLIRGDAPFVSNNFSQEAADMMAADQERGEVDKSKKPKRAPKDFEAGYRGSLHQSADGKWYGIPCVAFRAAMVRAASLCGVEMTKAKMTVFVMPDGFSNEGKGLVKITKGKPAMFKGPVRNANGSIDIRSRGRFDVGWECEVTIEYDSDFISASSVGNLLARAGRNVGVGAGRAFSTDSVGMGWGSFNVMKLVDQEPVAAE
jgi:hypothetical protein